MLGRGQAGPGAGPRGSPADLQNGHSELKNRENGVPLKVGGQNCVLLPSGKINVAGPPGKRIGPEKYNKTMTEIAGFSCTHRWVHENLAISVMGLLYFWGQNFFYGWSGIIFFFFPMDAKHNSDPKPSTGGHFLNF